MAGLVDQLCPTDRKTAEVHGPSRCRAGTGRTPRGKGRGGSLLTLLRCQMGGTSGGHPWASLPARACTTAGTRLRRCLPATVDSQRCLLLAIAKRLGFAMGLVSLSDDKRECRHQRLQSSCTDSYACFSDMWTCMGRPSGAPQSGLWPHWKAQAEAAAIWGRPVPVRGPRLHAAVCESRASVQECSGEVEREPLEKAYLNPIIICTCGAGRVSVSDQ